MVMFDHLPVAAVINGRWFCVHGGLSPELCTLDQIRTLDRNAEIPHTGPFCDLMWSDPDNIEGWLQSQRGAGYVFGSKVTKEFNHINGLNLIARAHQLIVFADEIYDKTLYDGHTHTSIASLADDVLFVTFNGLSKNYRSCGYRAGWMIVSGDKRHAGDYIEGLNMLASMRLCANTPGQLAIQTALGGYQSIKDLVAPGGRLCKQRDLAYELLTQIPGVSVVKPKAALYMFPRLDPKIYPIEDDQQFAYELLAEEKVLIVQGTGFNWGATDHFRLVFLPNVDDLGDAIGRIARFLGHYRKRHSQ